VGLGLCWEHVNKTTWFAGYSFEKFYQSIRRLYRFGQEHEVEVHVVRSENEGSIVDTVREKEKQHTELQCEVARLMSGSMKEELGISPLTLRSSAGTTRINLPNWLQSK
jgi:hypothetical protein